MKKTSRRIFLEEAAKTGVIFGSAAALQSTFTEKGLFVHHVYFWLQHPESKEDLDNLIKGLKTLARIPYIKFSHIGKPATTSRDVIDTSYSVSWLLFFDSIEEEERYQKDAVHLKFVEDYKHLWTKVVVYDSVEV